MKKILSIMLAVVIICFNCVVMADGDDIKVYLNDNEISFDQPPVIQDDRTLVPMRAIFEALGAEIIWNEETKTIIASKDARIMFITIGSNVADVNGFDVPLDVPACIINDRTMVPLRFISENLDCSVAWDGQTRSVSITTNEVNINNEVSFYDEFPWIPSLNAPLLNKFQDNGLDDYMTYVYEYKVSEVPEDVLLNYLMILPEYGFEPDEEDEYADGGVFFSYNNDQTVIYFPIVGSDGILRIMIGNWVGTSSINSNTYQNNINIYNTKSNEELYAQAKAELDMEYNSRLQELLDMQMEIIELASVDPYSTEEAQEIYTQYRKQYGAIGVNSSASSNGGNIDSYSAANAMRQQAALQALADEQARNAILSIHNAKIEGLQTKLDSMKKWTDDWYTTAVNALKAEYGIK